MGVDITVESSSRVRDWVNAAESLSRRSVTRASGMKLQASSYTSADDHDGVKRWQYNMTKKPQSLKDHRRQTTLPILQHRRAVVSNMYTNYDLFNGKQIPRLSKS